MTVNDLKDYFTSLSDHGYSGATVLVANKAWNPLTEGDEICDALFIESKEGDSIIVLQTD